MPAPKGHKKWGGKKKGTKNKKTLELEMALDLYKQEMLKNLMPIIRSQRQLAEGLAVVLRRKLVKKGKKWVREGELVQVKDKDEIERLLNSDGQGDNWHIITIKDPNVKAIQDILDRIFGKPKETVDANIIVKVKKLKTIQDGITKALKKNE
jgi:hypothetical protein